MECLICGETVDKDDKLVIQNPRLQGLKTIISASEKRQDMCAQKILQYKESILNGKMKVKFHIGCRQSYTSVQNLRYASQITEEFNNNNNASSSQARSNKPGFNIRTMCLICGKSGKKGKKPLISIQTGK